MRLLYNPTQLTCNLTIGDWPACSGIQKITGFSRGWHHWNSIRLGYNRSDGAKFVRLFMYAYVNGNRVIKMLGEFEVGKELEVDMRWNRYNCLITLDQYYQALTHVSTKTLPIGYQLFPYAEIDGTEKRTPFNPDIRDLVVR